MTSTSDNSVSVLIITVNEYYYIPKFLDSVIEADSVNIIGITTLPVSLGSESLWRFGIDLVRRFGLRVSISHICFYLRHMYDDIRYRLGLGGTPRSVGTLASEHGVETRHVKEINSHSYLEYVRELQPDVIASVAATQRFEPELLNISAKATINVHSSLLPEYRGVSPSFWTLLNDENQTGVTAHLMNETIDTGDVIVQRPIDIETNETLHSLNKKVAEVGADVLLDALEAVRTGTVDTTPIDPDEGSYYSLPEREDVRLFQRKGNKFY